MPAFSFPPTGVPTAASVTVSASASIDSAHTADHTADLLAQRSEHPGQAGTSPAASGPPDDSAPGPLLSAFAGFRCIDRGARDLLLSRLRALDPPPEPLVRVFDDATGSRLDFDLRPQAAGAEDAAGESVSGAGRGALAAPRAVGRPKLGVVAREVTLLPRHWDWLARQPGGASVALRKLVEEARRTHEGRDVVRAAREACYRFMTEIAGDLPGFEEAARALFAGERERFETHVSAWPEDVRSYLARLAASAWSAA
ncbi:MAG: DUF2239 family protein [Comamonadaceae bacterium]|nr:MAG: DUF2239 family protein [Comamonadaceae bacterium]